MRIQWMRHTMFPPTQNLNIDPRAISGITGSISIACWVIVFSPQIIVNFRRRSASGLSLTFLIVWLLGDVFNVLGAVLQGVLPTMIILALYYTFADIVLLSQCLYYNYRYPSTQPVSPSPCPSPSPEPVFPSDLNHHHHHYHHHHHIPEAVHLSPATPLLDPPKPGDPDDLTLTTPTSSTWSVISTIVFNTIAIITVCLAGVLGWYLTPPSPISSSDSPITFSPIAQLFGYLCALLYLASRLPQIYLNYRRKTVEGLSLLFFLFACLGNLTYVISIISYIPPGPETGEEPWTPEMKRTYWKYIAVNSSWILGSVGTLGLDMVIFMQFFIYRDASEEYLYDDYRDDYGATMHDNDHDCDDHEDDDEVETDGDEVVWRHSRQRRYIG
ncbi:PQ loop repeat-domain-containing protein [Kalaharituber pfeilii]|nr:PQ loop repeat-domain-containing protein [Kalaharituber pfeilii]